MNYGGGTKKKGTKGKYGGAKKKAGKKSAKKK